MSPTASVVVADPNLAIGQASVVTFTFSEAVTGFSLADLTVVNGTLSGLFTSDNITWTATLTPDVGVTDLTNVITLHNAGVVNGGNETGVGTTDSNNYAIDTMAPFVNSVSVPANGAYATGDNLDFTVNLNESVTVDTSGGTPRIALVVGASTTYADYLSGSGTSALVFRHTVQAGELDSNGVTVGALALNGGTIGDAAGNAASLTLNSMGSTAGVQVDAIAPSAPSAPDMTAGSDSGVSSSDDITAVTTPTFTGTAEAGSTVILYDTDGATVLGTGLATGGTWSITSSALSAGAHTLTAVAADAVDNISSASSGLAVTIDTTAPTLAITSNIASLKIGDTATITFTFSEDPGSTFSSDDLAVTGGTLGAISGSGATRTAVFTPTAGVDNGTASIMVAPGSYTDAAGNAGAAATTPSLTYDTLAPHAPSTPDMTASSDSGVSSSDDITTVTTPTFTGTAEAGSTVTLYDTDGATVLGTGLATGGNWSITSSALSAGAHTLTAQAADAAGNHSTASAGLSITIGPPAPPPAPPPPSVPAGTSGPDLIVGDDRDNAINGGGGSDSISGGHGQDTILGGVGDDLLQGNSGRDTIEGGADADAIRGGQDDDVLQGNGGADLLFGDKGADTLHGGQDADAVQGGEGADMVFGDKGDDAVRGGQGDDQVFGGDGNDFLSGDLGADTLTGGAGADIFHTHGAAGMDLVTDFNAAEGDRVNLLSGTQYTVAQAGADVVISLTGGGQMVFEGVQLSTLPSGWIFGA